MRPIRSTWKVPGKTDESRSCGAWCWSRSANIGRELDTDDSSILGVMKNCVPISPFGSLPVIVFYNESRKATDAIVCPTKAVLEREHGRLLSMKHIKILAVTDARVYQE